MTTSNEDMVELARMIARLGREREATNEELKVLRSSNEKQAEALTRIAHEVFGVQEHLPNRYEQMPKPLTMDALIAAVKARVTERNAAEAELEALEEKIEERVASAARQATVEALMLDGPALRPMMPGDEGPVQP